MPRKMELPEVATAPREYKINPEIEAKIDKFIAENAGYVKSIREMPRDRLERKLFLMRAEQQESRIGYRSKVMAWLEENPDIKERIEQQFAYLRSERQREQMVISAAKGEIHNRGIRL